MRACAGKTEVEELREHGESVWFVKDVVKKKIKSTNKLTGE